MSKQLPKSFNDLTIEEFQAASLYLDRLRHPLTPEEKTDVWIDVLSFFTGKTQEYYETLPFDKLNPLIAKCKFLTNPNDITEVNETVIINNQFYKGLTDMTKGSYAQFASIKTILSHDQSAQSYHKLLGCIYAPIKLYGKEYDMLEVQEQMKQAKVGQVLGLVFFYSKVFNRLTSVINDYMKIAEVSLQNSEKNLETSTAGT